MNYYGKTVVDFVLDGCGFDDGYDEFNRVILVTSDGMTHEEWLTDDELDDLTDDELDDLTDDELDDLTDDELDDLAEKVTK